jgi:tRNA G18 (ribose-2'-O)-methylase SpoU
MIRHIQSLEIPALEPYRTLRRPLEHIRKGIFVAEGEKVVRRLLDSGLQVISLLLTARWLQEFEKVHSFDDVDVFVGDQKLLETIVGYPLHQGVMAVANVPPEPDLGSWNQGFVRPYTLVALDGIVSAENVGVIVRNCGAFGVSGILVDRRSSSPYLRRAVRNSMGAVFRIPIVHVDLPEVLPALGCTILGTAPDGDVALESGVIRGDVCIVFGNEGNGISDAVLNLCDHRVAIRMKNETDSLNVGSASAVVLYEMSLRRADKCYNSHS